MPTGDIRRCSGPCAQGRSACPTPEACETPEHDSGLPGPAMCWLLVVAVLLVVTVASVAIGGVMP